MDKKIHIIVTGEVGGIRSFALSRPGLKITLWSMAFIFCVATSAGVFFSGNNLLLQTRVASLESDLQHCECINEST